MKRASKWPSTIEAAAKFNYFIFGAFSGMNHGPRIFFKDVSWKISSRSFILSLGLGRYLKRPPRYQRPNPETGKNNRAIESRPSTWFSNTCIWSQGRCYCQSDGRYARAHRSILVILSIIEQKCVLIKIMIMIMITRNSQVTVTPMFWLLFSSHVWGWPSLPLRSLLFISFSKTWISRRSVNFLIFVFFMLQ